MSLNGDDPSGEAPVVTISSDVMIAAVLFVFLTVVFVFFLYLYAKHYWTPAARRRRSRAHFISTADPIPGPGPRRGLDPAVLRAIPVTVFRSSPAEPLECPVCLSELSDGEAARVLPKCSHSFHVECIDEWFQSHSTCPLCRSAVDAVTAGTVAPDITINVQLIGDPASGSSSSAAGKQGGELVIEIPRRGGAVEGMQSPSSAGLRSLKRMWSRGKRAVGTSSSTPMGVGGDLELGPAGEEGGAAAATGTPKTHHPH